MNLTNKEMQAVRSILKKHSEQVPEAEAPMELNDSTREQVLSIIEQHLDEVKGVERLHDQGISMFAGEVRYEDFLEGIIQKLKR
jgi:peptide subunit release factor 1 (eRF1)